MHPPSVLLLFQKLVLRVAIPVGVTYALRSRVERNGEMFVHFRVSEHSSRDHVFALCRYLNSYASSEKASKRYKCEYWKETNTSIKDNPYLLYHWYVFRVLNSVFSNGALPFRQILLNEETENCSFAQICEGLHLPPRWFFLPSFLLNLLLRDVFHLLYPKLNVSRVPIALFLIAPDVWVCTRTHLLASVWGIIP